MSDHPSDSATQRAAENELIRAVSRKINIELTPKTIRVAESASVQIDGFNANELVACEAFSRIGKMNAGQKRKLGNDILKLLLLERHLQIPIRKLIVLAGDDALASLTGKSWQAAAVREFGVEVFQIELSDATRIDLGAAQVRQVMVNSPT